MPLPHTQRERERERERGRGQLQVEIGLLCGYIGILIGEMKGHKLPTPPTPYILGRDPPIRQHESKYMPATPEPTGSWGYAPLDD